MQELLQVDCMSWIFEEKRRANVNRNEAMMTNFNLYFLRDPRRPKIG